MPIKNQPNSGDKCATGAKNRGDCCRIAKGDRRAGFVRWWWSGNQVSLSSNDVARFPMRIVSVGHRQLSYTNWWLIIIMAITIYNPGTGPDSRGSAGDGRPEVRGRQNYHGGLLPSFSSSASSKSSSAEPSWQFELNECSRHQHLHQPRTPPRCDQWLSPPTTWSPPQTLPHGPRLTSRWDSYCCKLSHTIVYYHKHWTTNNQQTN